MFPLRVLKSPNSYSDGARRDKAYESQVLQRKEGTDTVCITGSFASVTPGQNCILMAIGFGSYLVALRPNEYGGIRSNISEYLTILLADLLGLDLPRSLIAVY